MLYDCSYIIVLNKRVGIITVTSLKKKKVESFCALNQKDGSWQGISKIEAAEMQCT